jgi:predicted amidophosphoribosyltransferase
MQATPPQFVPAQAQAPQNAPVQAPPPQYVPVQAPAPKNKICNECGQELPPDATVCTLCAAPLYSA